ncbi:MULTISPECIES: O-succinylhomoserine sulfhydrylase [unclassified Variovorax]|uniref:O-succinylhomoserine sulfhydrylase n=1 Tax=unclassified Variovorax TaxID=663243 RepID=UPI00131692FA|nr:O-succinylhomoserine sulfhydrylase [Variovorax sp. SRS16]VTU28875.1 O-succinylhomoserine sulfhydrylase [Variovorax sp. PBL-E5]
MQARDATRAVHVGQHQDLSDAHCEPIALTSSYVFASAADAAGKFSGAVPGNVYSRFTNPTVRAFEQRLASLEEAEDCAAFASGMAAIVAIAHACLAAGSNVVCSRDVFGTTLTAFRRYFGKLGIELRAVGLTQLHSWHSAIDERTRLVFLETPSNPLQQVADIGAIAAIAHAAGAWVVVDNTMLTPVCQKPLRFGADIVVHSAGKYIDGQGRSIGGAALGSERLMGELRGVLRTLGSSLGPMNAWLLLKSIETLALRVHAINQTAGRLACWLATHPKVAKVHYTGLPGHAQRALVQRQQTGCGGVLGFEIAGGREAAWQLIDALRLVSIATNMGDTRSMVTHPATTTHGRLTPEERQLCGITSGLVRLSVGLEHQDDLLADLDQALSTLPDFDAAARAADDLSTAHAPCRPH